MRLYIFVLISFIFLNNTSLCADETDSDTIIVNLSNEEIHYYVYHYIDNGVPHFSNRWGGLFGSEGKYILKSVLTTKPFSGVLIIQNPHDRAQFTCNFLDGVPNGIWKKHINNNYQEPCKAYPILVYEIPIKLGFPNGRGYKYATDSSEIRSACFIDNKGLLVTSINYENGIPCGRYEQGLRDSNIGEAILANLDFAQYYVEKPNLKYGNPTIRAGLRKYVEGIDVLSLLYNRDFVYRFDIQSKYWPHQLQCHTLNPKYFGLTYSNLSEPLTFVTIKDTFIRFSGLVGGNLVKKEESHWKDGHCLKFIEYNYSYQNRLDDNYVKKEVEYEYHKGYLLGYVKENFRLKLTSRFEVKQYHNVGDLIDLSGWDISKSYRNQIFLDTSFYFNYSCLLTPKGIFKHGYYDNEWGFGEVESSKFSIPYYLSEGEYYFGNKAGTWKYYILVKNQKVLIASVDYKVVKNSKALSFVARKDYSDFCSGDWQPTDIGARTSSIIEGKMLFYNSDGSLYMGYNYINGYSVGLIKP